MSFKSRVSYLKFQYAFIFSAFLLFFTPNTLVFAEEVRVIGKFLSFSAPFAKYPAGERGDTTIHSEHEVFRLAQASTYCPRIIKLYTNIFKRIIEQNSLKAFAEQDPPLELKVHCRLPSFLANSLSPNFRSSPTRRWITMTSPFVTTLDSEDEIAFIISHEIAHALFLQQDIDNNNNNGQSGSSTLTKHQEKSIKAGEFKADIYGAILMLNAGYSSKALDTVFRNMYAHLGILNLIAIKYLHLTGKLSEEEFFSTHGSPTERYQNVSQTLSNLLIQLKYLPLTRSLDFFEARAESYKIDYLK